MGLAPECLRSSYLVGPFASWATDGMQTRSGARRWCHGFADSWPSKAIIGFMWKETTGKLNRRREILRGLFLVVVVASLMIVSFVYGRSQGPAGISGEDSESLRLYAEALDAVNDDYVDQRAVDPQKQTEAAIEGMLGSLGDEGHTRYLTPEEVAENEKGLSGTYVGVGVQLKDEDRRIVVTAPIDGSPAEEAGIRTGDVIIAVNGESVEGQDVAQIADKVRGPEGTQVGLTVRRGTGAGAEERKYDLRREELEVQAASWAMIPGTNVAHLQLSSFSAGAAEQLKAAVAEALEAGATGFVLDLRGNPGGRVEEAMGVAEIFLKPNDVIYIRKDASGREEKIRASDDADGVGLPVTVLVNGGTASSAEIVAGALRDDEGAKVVGETTYGTGTVLAERRLSDGSSILLGIAEWLTPKGDFIRESGIEPDIRSLLEGGQEPLDPEQTRTLSRGEVFDRDAQLRRATEVLTSR